MICASWIVAPPRSDKDNRGDKQTGTHDHDSDFPEVFDLPDELGDVELFGFSIDGNRDLPIRRSERQQSCHLCLLPLNPEVRIGFELRDHMITTRSTHPDQGFGR